VAGGLALAGETAIVEIMFADFVALAFDQIVNFAGKSVSMYGRRLSLSLLVRCPSGGGRGYGPTHSQSLQKHFVGVPGLSLYEISPFHDNRELLPRILSRAEPAILFEDKVLYSRRMFTDGRVDDLFGYRLDESGVAEVVLHDIPDHDCVLVVPGGMAHRALAAARRLMLEHEIACRVLVPERLYPFDADPLRPLLRSGESVFVAEESTAGGTWGAEVAHILHTHLWERLARPVTLLHSAAGVIPTAPHLEERVLLDADTICHTIAETLRE
jgi:pyruvate/2-oxoglutarate/acetoin dehydrogenase E1 component